MQTIINDTKDALANVTVNVSRENLDHHINNTFRKNKNLYNVPGFRKGKAPRALIERYYGEDIFTRDAMLDIVEEYFKDHLYEDSFTPVGSFRDLDLKPVTEEGFEFSFTIPIVPEFELTTIEDLNYQEPELKEITEKEVEEELKLQATEYPNLIEKDNNPQVGDIVNLTFYKLKDSNNLTHLSHYEDNYDLELTDDMVEIIKDQPKNKFENHEFNNDTYRVKVNYLFEKQDSNIDDSFAQKVSTFDNLEDYKNFLLNQLKEERDLIKKQAAQDFYIQNLLDENEFEFHHYFLEDLEETQENKEKKVTSILKFVFDDYDDNLSDVENLAKLIAQNEVLTRLVKNYDLELSQDVLDNIEPRKLNLFYQMLNLVEQEDAYDLVYNKAAKQTLINYINEKLENKDA